MKSHILPKTRAILEGMKSLQLSKPHAILVIGIPGSGKTYFAQHFSETFHAPFIDAHQLHAHISNETAADEVAKMFLTEVAKTHQTFLYEPATGSRAARSDFARWARTTGYEPMIVWVQVDNTTAERRAQKGGIDFDEYQRLLRHFSPPHVTEKPVVISGKHTQASQTRTILTRLSANHPTEQSVAVPTRPTGRRIDISRA